MGLFWDLMQQNQISEQQRRASSVEERMDSLEREVVDIRQLLQVMLERLEKALGEDIDRDGRIG